MEKEEGEKKNWLMRMPAKTKMLPSNQQKFKSSVLEISLLAIPMLTGRKAVQKEGYGPKCGFFSLKIGRRQRVLSKNVLERNTSTGSEKFCLAICLDATKFALFRVFILTETICLKTQARSLPENEKVHFRLTCVAHKRLCLTSLLLSCHQSKSACKDGGYRD